MSKNILLQRSKKPGVNLKLSREETVRFAREQFEELMKKNLRVPVKLYHL